jgi:hypothetical protein
MWEYMKFWIARVLADVLVGAIWLGVGILVIGAFHWLFRRR